MSSATNQRIVEFLSQYPLLGVIVFLFFGGWMTTDALRNGRELTRYLNGPRVQGSVVELRGKAMPPAKFEMTARWRAPNGGSDHSGTVRLYKSEFERLQRGARVDLILAADQAGSAITPRHLEGHEPVVIAGVPMDPLGFGGIAIMLLGLFFPLLVRTERKQSRVAA